MMGLQLEPAVEGEVGAAIDVLRSAGLGTNVGRLLEFPLRSPAGSLLVARDGGRVVGGAAVVCFGATGWIGALGVSSSVRRRGIGGALTRVCVDWLHERGAATVLLYATPAGRPVYLREGFVVEGDARAWRDVSPPRDAGRLDGRYDVRPAEPDDLPGIRALDRVATGEDRDAVLRALPHPFDGIVACDGDGQLAGSALRSPWGLGPGVVAATPAAALELVSVLRRARGGPLTISLPEANAAGCRALRDWGFESVNSATRMRLGPAPAYDPARVFGLFNLFWG